MTSNMNNKEVYAEVPLVKETDGKYYLLVDTSEKSAPSVRSVFAYDARGHRKSAAYDCDIPGKQLTTVEPGDYVIVHYYSDQPGAELLGEIIRIHVTKVGKTARGTVENDLHIFI